MAVSRRSDGLRRTLPLLGGIGASGLALIGLAALEVRHRRALGSDEEWAALRSPLVGREAQVTSSDGTLLDAALVGDGDGPTFVLAPGWTEEVRIWGPVARGLVQRGFKVIVYDLRGQGASGQAGSGEYTLARYGEDLDAILAFAAEETGAGPESLIVAGHSLGGMSVVAWAISHPPRSRVRAAALINAAVAGVISESRIGQFPGVVKQWLGMNLVLNNPMPRLALSTAVSREVLRRAAFGSSATAAQVALLERMQWACPTTVRTAAGRSIAGMDLSWALSALTVPTLVVAGDCDRLLPRTHSERMAAALPSLVDLVILPEIGYLSPLEAPDRLVDELVRLEAVTGIRSSSH
jgi:pimeloyl-ACP methyl ester carboxylesterase